MVIDSFFLKLRSVVFLLILLICSAVIFAASDDKPKKASRHVLDNGLTVVVKEDRRAPVFVAQVWYKVGAVDEPVGRTGVAHVVEHMMFKGTAHLAPGRFSNLVAEFGGYENAATTSDHTYYYAAMDISRLPLLFALEADRMSQATMSEEEFKRELQVVQEERRLRVEDSPPRLFGERFYSVRYDSSGYSHPIAGWMSDLQRMTVDDVKMFYKRWYRPANAVLVVVGDVNTDFVIQEAEKTFGRVVQDGFGPQPMDVIELPPVGKKEFVVKLPTQIPMSFMGFAVPSMVTSGDKNDILALTILSEILGGGDVGRLNAEMVRGQESAAFVSVSFEPFQRGDSTFLFGAAPNIVKGKTLADVRKAFEKEIKKIQSSPPTSEEIDQVRARIMALQVYSEDEITNLAVRLGKLEALGLGIEYLDEYFTKLKQVTAEDVQRVAKKYLVDDRLVYGELLPSKPAVDQKEAGGDV